MTKIALISHFTTSTNISKTKFYLLNFTLLVLIILFIPINSIAADYDNDPIRTLLPFDAIPAITNPQFVPAAKANLDADAPVIGVTFNGESHAYSIYLLNGHEIVNDVVGGEKIATTW